MSQTFDRIAIAARIRGLIAGQDGGDPAAVAERLRVDEIGLRMSIDELAPNPTVDVIAALVATYGVDPSWLLTGEYDPSTHRSILEERNSVEQVVSRLMMPLARASGSMLRLL
jgi:hypothetical protein